MAELFFQHNAIPYLFDTKSLKLLRLEGNHPIEIDNPETLQNVRFYSVEISREIAFKMAGLYRPDISYANGF
jgi:hypothetical protein